MLTIFTTAKPFIGKIKVNQYNAIRSWKALPVEKEIILFGEGEGYSKAVSDLNIEWIPEVETSSQGTPLVNSMFQIARDCGKYQIKMYINSDIVLLSDFPTALKSIRFNEYLVVSQRYDLNLNEIIDFNKPDLENELRRMISNHAKLHPPSGSDIFCFAGWPWGGIPELVIGRAGYDNELIFHCRNTRVPVIDATGAITLIHQNHGYAHHKNGRQGVWHGQEAKTNMEKGKSRGLRFTILEADYMISGGKIVRNKRKVELSRKLRARKEICRSEIGGSIIEYYIRLIGIINRRILLRY
ncbi:MAG: hypothetical protein GQ565_07170 [Candidatus Aegiribacteria sp.]|nr:hypothetical protein [Candidatus Aegiribacteria sp.]